ncbi:MAG: SUMF1/EgtB/PvdO family nonheme iron enzyme [Chlamydiia bacterium]|nr:SUMF1/EgtB/PvdO family nonheme iron enzyme [Chlamydiia bacterium]
MEIKELGDYAIIKQIGQGTLGTCFLAEHKFMKRQFVIKLLPEELSQDRAFIQRFEEGIGALSHLNHPNIVETYNISFDQGKYFLVTDCIIDDYQETTNLSQYVTGKRRPLTTDEAYPILHQIADALDFVHRKKNLAHNSLKPNNILIGKGKEGVKVYLSDFGLSRIVGSGLVLSRTFKSVSESLGIDFKNTAQDGKKVSALASSFLQNYQFLAPEQRRSQFTSGPQADVWAFGVLTYWLLTGEYPEGNFSSLEPGWHRLVLSCLETAPDKRAKGLKSALEATQASTASAEKFQVEIPQMAQAAVGVLKPVIHTPRIDRPTVDLDPAASLVVDTTVTKYTPEPKDLDSIKPLETKMVVVEGGEFVRGSKDGNRDEMPQHRITLPSFAIDVHPVTNEQFVRFLEAMGGEKDINHNDIIRMKDSRIKRSTGKLAIESGYLKHPVVGVTWYGALSYAKWVGKRLPTEAEWEIAASACDESNLYPSGEDIEKTQANFFSSDTTAVMSYQPNPIGLHDMAGNVYEWVNDWYGYNYYEQSMQEPVNPMGPIQGVYRVLRGGCWKSLKEDLRCSRRHRNNPGTVNGTYGFRCAADVQ